MTLNKKQLAVGSGVLIALAVILGLGAMLLYQVRYVHSESAFIGKAAALFGMDMAKVDGKNVPYSEYLTHASAERTFLNSPMAKQDGSTGAFGKTEEKQAFDRALRVAAVDALARENNLTLTSKDVDAAFEQLLTQTTSSSNPGEVDAFLREQFGWSTEEFKHYVLRPAIIEETLASKLNDQTGKATGFQDALTEILDKKTERYLKF
ncbi:MAG: hypothetical protein U0487_03515 [Patescibacteria group bacterium]